MNSRSLGALSIAIACLMTPVAFGQEDQSVPVVEEQSIRTIEPGQLHILSDESARRAVAVKATLGNAAVVTPSGSLPLWTYSANAVQNGQKYGGMIVGQSPVGNNTTTTVPAVLIPVVLKITQGGTTYTFDPTSTDPGCLGTGNTAFSLTQSSPLFQSAAFTFNGTAVGDTQYGDAFLRGEFWSYTRSEPSYHLTLTPSTASKLTISVNAGRYGSTTAAVYNLSGSQCGYNTGTNPHAKIGVININTIDTLLQNYITANGLNASQFPFFVLYNAVMSEGPANNLNYCCVLGYHNALGNPGQTYGIAEFEGRDQTVFSGVSDVSAGSHEINEWINDPNGSNPTPAWGNIGQVSGCQSNFEVGDPLSGSLMPTITMPNGFTYHVQELAYFSWFYGQNSYGAGAGGKYSSNGTFGGYAKLCPPGGTN